MRLAHRIARSGLCSRRAAERLVQNGEVEIENKLATDPALFTTEHSQIRVRGRDLPRPEPARLWRHHKKIGVLTSRKSNQNRATVFDGLPAGIKSIGRLDINTSGLILLTNNGELQHRLERPGALVRRYRARAYSPYPMTPERFESMRARLAKGCRVEGIEYAPVKILVESRLSSGHNHWFRLELLEGKNRQIHKLLARFAFRVNRLVRISYGPLSIGEAARRAEPEDSSCCVAKTPSRDRARE